MAPVSLNELDTKMVLLIAKHFDQSKFKDIIAEVQAADPTLAPNTIRMRWTRVVKKLEKAEAGDGAEDAAADGEKPKGKAKAVKGPKDGVKKVTTPRKPRAKKAIKEADAEDAMKLENGGSGGSGSGDDKEGKDEGMEDV